MSTVESELALPSMVNPLSHVSRGDDYYKTLREYHKFLGLIKITRLMNNEEKTDTIDFNGRKLKKNESDLSKAFGLLYSLVQHSHADTLTNNTPPWTALLRKFNYTTVDPVTVENIQQHFYALRIFDDLTLDFVEALTTKFVADMESDQVSANPLVANSITEAQLVAHFRAHYGVLRPYITTQVLQLGIYSDSCTD